MSKQPRRGRQVRDRKIKQLKREHGISHTAALRLLDAGRDAAPLPTWVPPKPNGVRVHAEWSTESTPFTPPRGVAPMPDPYGHELPVGASAYLLTFTMSDHEDEIYEMREAITYAHRFLVRPGAGWYRAAASVYGPIPIPMPYTSEAEPPAGHTTVTVLVTPFARIGAGRAEHIAFTQDSFRATRAAVLKRCPAPAELEPEWVPADPKMADGIRERLEPSTLSLMYLHPTLAGDLGPAFESYPERLVDIRCRGWQHTGQGRYRVDHQEQRGLPERTYDEVAAIDGPISVVEPPNPYNAEDFVAALEAAGTTAAACLLLALHQLAVEFAEWDQRAGEATCSLIAGAEESWQSAAMMAQIHGHGAALAGEPDRTVEDTVTTLKEELEGWACVSQGYTEVAENLAVLFSRAADGAGGWSALADPGLQAVGPLRDWLMSHTQAKPTEV